MIARPRKHMIDLRDLNGYSELTSAAEEEEDFDFDDGVMIEDFIQRSGHLYQELFEEVESTIEDLGQDDTIVRLFYGDIEDMRTFNGILTRMFQATSNQGEYISVVEEPLTDDGEDSDSDEDTSSEAEDSDTHETESSEADEDSDDSDDEHDSPVAAPAASASATSARPALPRPVGIPEPKTSSQRLELLASKRTRAVAQLPVDTLTKVPQVKSNFVEPDRWVTDGATKNVPRGLTMEKLEHNGAQITVFRNAAVSSDHDAPLAPRPPLPLDAKRVAPPVRPKPARKK